MAFALKGQTKVTMAFKVQKSYLSRFFFNSFQILRVGSLQKRKMVLLHGLCPQGQTKVTVAFKVQKSRLSRFLFNCFQIFRVDSSQKWTIILLHGLFPSKVAGAMKVQKSYLSCFLFNPFQNLRVGSSLKNMIDVHSPLCLQRPKWPLMSKNHISPTSLSIVTKIWEQVVHNKILSFHFLAFAPKG